MLQVTDIHTYYESSYVLQGVSMRVGRGEVGAVLGRNGAGKTTLVRSIMGATPPRRGRVVFGGRDIAGLPPHAVASLGIGLVPQGRRIFPSLSVRENIELGEGRSRAPSGPWNLARIFETFPVLNERRDQPGTALSGGEQQMLACARALVSNPQLLLMDEPSEGLAPQKVNELGAVMEEMRAGGLSVLLVEQKLPFAFKHADRVNILSRGAIVYDGTPAQLAADSNALERHLGVAPT